MKKKLVFLCVLGLLYNEELFADQITKQSDRETDFDTIIVTASKQSNKAASSRNVSSNTVSQAKLEAAGVDDTKKLSRVLPGLNIQNSGNLLFPAISLRGISSAQDFYSPAITFYVDGVPQLSTNLVQSLIDVEHVTMMKGPQATLYGRSAQGGIVNISTAKPNNIFRGYIDNGVASRKGYHSRLNLSGPLVEDLFYGSVTLLRQSQPGAFNNPSTGSHRLGGSNENTGNIKFRLAPITAPWEVNFSATEDRTHSTQDTYLDFKNTHSRKLLTSAGSLDPRMHRRTHSQTLNGSYDFGDWLLTASSAWQQLKYERRFPYGPYSAQSSEHWDQNTQEIRAATQGDNRLWDGVFGLYRLDIDESRQTSTTDSSVTSQSLAMYMDGTLHVSQFDLGAGLRVSHDKAKTHYGNNSAWSAGNNSDNQVLGQFSVGYLLTPDWRIYTRVAQGYKAAGFTITPQAGTRAEPFSAEKSINYEIGSRYEIDDFQLQSAVYYTHTKNMQLYSGPMGFQTLQNAGSANAFGIEADAKWLFAPGWAATLNGNLAHSKFASNVTADDYANNRVPFIPKYGAGFSVDGLVATLIGTVMPRITVNVTGPLYFDGSNQLRQGSYSTTDISLGWQANERITVSGYINNIFDRRYRTYGYARGNNAFAQFNEGLTAGVNIKVDLF